MGWHRTEDGVTPTVKAVPRVLAARIGVLFRFHSTGKTR